MKVSNVQSHTAPISYKGYQHIEGQDFNVQDSWDTNSQAIITNAGNLRFNTTRNSLDARIVTDCYDKTTNECISQVLYDYNGDILYARNNKHRDVIPLTNQMFDFMA